MHDALMTPSFSVRKDVSGSNVDLVVMIIRIETVDAQVHVSEATSASLNSIVQLKNSSATGVLMSTGCEKCNKTAAPESVIVAKRSSGRKTGSAMSKVGSALGRTLADGCIVGVLDDVGIAEGASSTAVGSTAMEGSLVGMLDRDGMTDGGPSGA
mmetsp:Transcript_14759/g.55861  ORF Transcript_14759/g.55861 Transcript_14759/m.55861 type:complete len:155 (-) Transcript_14759:272-736(-)